MTPGNHLCLLFFLHVLLVQLEDGLTLNMIMTSNSITYNLGKNQIKQQTSIPRPNHQGWEGKIARFGFRAASSLI